MFSAEYGTGPLGEFFAAEPVPWGGAMGPFFETVTPITYPDGGDIYSIPAVTPLGIVGDVATELRVRAGLGAELAAATAERSAAAAGAAAEYVSDIPGEIGEAAGELVAELGAGAGAGVQSLLEGFTTPLTAIPGDLFEGIPTWVPLLGAAFLLTRN